MYRIFYVTFFFLTMGVALLLSAADKGLRHPLDPLTWQEHWAVLEFLRAAGKLDDDTRFTHLALREPPKATVWSWRLGQRPSRAACAVIKQGARTYEATIDLDGQRLVSGTKRSGVQPAWLDEEFEEAIHEEVKKHPEVIAALRRRGITDRTFVDCSGGPPGYFAVPEEEGKRVAYVGCELPAGVRNVRARQIEGLIVVFDVNEKKVLQVIDEGVVPVP